MASGQCKVCLPVFRPLAPPLFCVGTFPGALKYRYRPDEKKKACAAYSKGHAPGSSQESHGPGLARFPINMLGQSHSRASTSDCLAACRHF